MNRDELTPAYNCPACGGPLSPHFRYTKMITCPQCGNGLFLEDQAVKLAGVKSVMAEYPSLLELYREFKYRKWRFQPIGHARFDYGQGFWDEWWVMDSKTGEGSWVSVDEGDYAIEQPVALPPQHNIMLPELIPGRSLRLMGENLLVTERGTATCQGVEGEFPELLKPGDQYQYVHLSGDKGRLFTLEIEDGNIECHEGKWVDPFEVEAL